MHLFCLSVFVGLYYESSHYASVGEYLKHVTEVSIEPENSTTLFSKPRLASDWHLFFFFINNQNIFCDQKSSRKKGSFVML
jgi:hypothetical protein